jgi:hypothetical protein
MFKRKSRNLEFDSILFLSPRNHSLVNIGSKERSKQCKKREPVRITNQTSQHRFSFQACTDLQQLEGLSRTLKLLPSVLCPPWATKYVMGPTLLRINLPFVGQFVVDDKSESSSQCKKQNIMFFFPLMSLNQVCWGCPD